MGPDAYADTLRAVGLFLDHQDADRVEILADPYQWSVSWADVPPIALEHTHLLALRSVARLHRGLPSRRRAYSRPGQLRAVGQLFDQIGASAFTIKEEPDGYEVTARVGQQEGTRRYRAEELTALISQRTEQRGEPGP